MKDKLRKLLNEFGSTAYGIMLENPEHLDEAAEEAAQTILNTLIEEVEGLYRPEITDLESNEYHGEDRPVIYLDQVINILKGDKDV